MNKTLIWEEYLKSELDYFRPKLLEIGYILTENQVHTKGERSAFRAKKVILLGESINNGQSVVIKISRAKEGIEEVLCERKAKSALKEINFNYKKFSDPKELYFHHENEELILVTEFIQERKKFLDRHTEEQFTIALQGFEILEGVHVTVKSHQKFVNQYFEVKDFEVYKKELEAYEKVILENFGNDNKLREILLNAKKVFLDNKYRISQYCGFLTHFDFVPHNFRVKELDGEDQIYLLDHSSLFIGNKHEGWGRFTNFMSLYNPDLEKAVLKYFELNRSLEEGESFRLMRIFRLFDLLHHHAKIFKETSNIELKNLSKERVYFWLELLKVVLENKFLDTKIIEDYKFKRDNLRSGEEKERQKVLY